MREVDAVYGGEMSAHHYFRRFSYCDSGMIPWLLVLAVLSERGRAALGSWWASACGCFRRAARSTASLPPTPARSWRGCGPSTSAQAQAIDLTDGLSMEFADWRFNLRGSNTEPLVRLNVESRGSEPLMREKTAELLKLIDG